VKDLKGLLAAMEADLNSIQSEIQSKAEERLRLSEKVRSAVNVIATVLNNFLNVDVITYSKLKPSVILTV
jgi:hypothetical protein